jgi:hypothetical protein
MFGEEDSESEESGSESGEGLYFLFILLLFSFQSGQIFFRTACIRISYRKECR